MRDGELLTRQGGVDVIVSAHVPGPMAAGIIQRRILLPADFLTRYWVDNVDLHDPVGEESVCAYTPASYAEEASFSSSSRM